MLLERSGADWDQYWGEALSEYGDGTLRHWSDRGLW